MASLVGMRGVRVAPGAVWLVARVVLGTPGCCVGTVGSGVVWLAAGVVLGACGCRVGAVSWGSVEVSCVLFDVVVIAAAPWSGWVAG